MIRFCKTELTKEDTVLVPYRSLWVRLLIFAALMSTNFIGTPSWYKVLFIGIFLALVLGTFPRVRCSHTMVEVVFLVMFVAVHVKRWRFDDFNRIQTGSDETGGPSIPVLEPVLDWLMPWLGGDCRIWLRGKRGKRVLLWRGSNDLHFRENLKFLENTACLPVEPEQLD